jgi:unsaturated rhamnogalacturonyl hydrolase
MTAFIIPIRSVCAWVSLIILQWLPSSAAAQQSLDTFQRDAILRLMHKVNDWQQAHPWKAVDRDWIRATWYTGVMAAYKATSDERFMQQALRWGRHHQWQVGAEVLGANKLFCVETWLELYLVTQDKAMLEPAVKWLATSAANSPAGKNSQWYAFLNNKFGYQNLLYVDSLYGAPALAMLARVTGDQHYLDIMHHFFWDVASELYDKEEHLFYRDRRFIDSGPEKRIVGHQDPLRRTAKLAQASWTRTRQGKKVLWSRGNGWAFGGLARILEYLPENDPQRRRYVEMFQAMSAEFARRQAADGMWRPNLDDPDEFPMKESSGSGFFCYGLAWGINHGLLDRKTYLPVVMRAWAGLVSCVSPEGKVQWGQREAGWPEPVMQDDTHEYVTGTLLLAGSEVYRLAEAN